MVNYFVRNINGYRDLFKTTNNGSKYYNTTRHIVKQMVWDKGLGMWVEKPNAAPIVLVYGTIKGFSANVSDEDILGVIDNNLSDAQRERDFNELRKYFNEPNATDVETWHRAGETILSQCLWTPYDEIPNGVLN